MTTDVDYIKACLSYIDPSLPRSDWVNVGMALQFELGDNVGYQVFKEWSQQSSEFNARQFEATWKSFKQGFASFKMGTIVHYAKQGGFDPRSINIKPQERSEAERARLESERRKFDEMRRLEAREKAEAAREIATKRWSRSPAPDTANIHPYLLKKQCPHPAGPVKQYKNFLQIPAFNKEGTLTTLLSINDTGFKSIIKDSILSGSSMTIGKKGADLDKPVLLCEGWATGQSLYAASKQITEEGLQVVVAFNSNNMLHVAKNIRERYPDRPILICADNDCCNQQNAGLKAAEATQKAIGDNIGIIYPEFPQELIQEKLLAEESVPTDFNDAHCLYDLDQVAAYIRTGVLELEAVRDLKDERNIDMEPN
ncbi:hypothetical protein L1281_001725 [Neisseria sp. HSC-16F19]|nr:PriCT-2 domain-containing protein [Neisseria sp. HSC-16F19]MCP2041131.1 hypothetical protein [Neisseria sp. HSC-16F19]